MKRRIRGDAGRVSPVVSITVMLALIVVAVLVMRGANIRNKMIKLYNAHMAKMVSASEAMGDPNDPNTAKEYLAVRRWKEAIKTGEEFLSKYKDFEEKSKDITKSIESARRQMTQNERIAIMQEKLEQRRAAKSGDAPPSGDKPAKNP